MDVSINQETVNDVAKRMMHRLVSRRIGDDPSLVKLARQKHAESACRYSGRAFFREWNGLLELPLTDLRARLISRDSEMVRLRLSSPLLVTPGIDFSNYDFRLRIRRAARRIAARSLRKASPVEDT